MFVMFRYLLLLFDRNLKPETICSFVKKVKERKRERERERENDAILPTIGNGRHKIIIIIIKRKKGQMATSTCNTI